MMISLREYILNELVPKLPLYEQAVNRDKFIDKVMDNTSPLMSHWGLIEYAHGDFENNDSYEQYINHWKKELRSFCKEIADRKIKGGNRNKAIKYALIVVEELNDWEQVYELIRDKFEDENIDMFTAKKVAKILSQNIDELINALSDKSYREWIEEL